MNKYDVIITGAGPVGLFLACELALKKCSVLILEQADNPHSPLKRLPFGMRGLSVPTIEALYRRGLLDKFPIPQRRQAGHFAGIPFDYNNIDTSKWAYRLPGPGDTNISAEMEHIETVLTNHAIELGVEIKRGLAVTDFHQTNDEVNVKVGTQSMEFNSKWLVGCDGGRSIVRKKGGFEFTGTDPEFTGYSFQADTSELPMGRNYTPTGMYFQMQPGVFAMVDYDGGAFHRSEPVTPEHIQAVLRRISNTDIIVTALHMVTTWTDRSQQATAYRNGRVLLAGDAAHIHSPLGGQGLNLGLGDAMNLGWKLAATIRGEAPEGLLDTYFSERHPVGEKVLDWSRAQVKVMHFRALEAVFRDLINTRDGATYFAERVWAVSLQYNLNEEHPLVGRSVPNFELENGSNIGELLNDAKALLLDFDSNEELKHLADGRIKYVASEAKDRLGLSAVLVRPDGFVAWACDGKPDINSAARVISHWFGN
jgi:2-polyprenyl-6-methoxyphenol hydroxylase-like FAD-dependent oxidoreductase